MLAAQCNGKAQPISLVESYDTRLRLASGVYKFDQFPFLTCSAANLRRRGAGRCHNEPSMAEDTRTPAPEGAVDDRRQYFARDKDSAMGEEGRRSKGKRRRKVSYLTVNKIDKVDYKEITVLRRFLNERGKILPSRQTGTTAKQQRMIASAIRKAREMALLPFVVTEMSERREPSYRRERYQPRGQEPPREAKMEAPVEEAVMPAESVPEFVEEAAKVESAVPAQAVAGEDGNGVGSEDSAS